MLERNITRRLIEQLAFSLALSEFSQLIPAENHIGHYWGNKEEWQSFIVASFLKSYFGNTTLNEQIESFKSLDYTKIPIALKIPNTRCRLFNLITKLFPEKDKRYIMINKE